MEKIKMAKKKPVQNDFWYVIVRANDMAPFRDLQKALEQAKDLISTEEEMEPLQVLEVTQSWVIEVPETPEPVVGEEHAEDMLFYDEL